MESNSNKLGLAWQKCTQGLNNIPLCNEGEWINKLRDIRHYLKLFDGLVGSEQAVTFLSYAERGAFIVVLAPLTDNLGNYKAVWIYVPNNIEISAYDLETAYNKAKHGLLSGRGFDELKDDDLFSSSYPQKACPDYSPSTRDNKFAVFVLGSNYNLWDILGSYLYQEKFSKYDAVFLLDKNGEIEVREEYRHSVEDLSKETLERYFVLHHLNAEKFHGNPQISLRVNDGNPFLFDRDMRVKENDKLQFTLERDGYQKVDVRPIHVKDENSIQTIYIENILNDEVTWMKRITKDQFKFIGKDPKDPITVKVNGQVVEGSGILVKEADCKIARIEIDSEKYEITDNRQSYNLLEKEVKIQLEREKRQLHAKIKLENGEEANITLESKYLEEDYFKRYVSPLKGYCFQEDQNLQKTETLIPRESGKWMHYIKGALAILAIAIILIGGYGVNEWWNYYWTNHKVELRWRCIPVIVKTDTAPTPVPTTTEKPKVDPSPTVPSYGIDHKAVLEYLDGNKTWQKDSLEKYPETKGLFDALNNYNIKEIKRIYTYRLQSKSENLRKIVDALPQNIYGQVQQTYNSENDFAITIETYIETIKKKTSTTSSPSSGHKTSSPSNTSSTNKSGNTVGEEGSSGNGEAKRANTPDRKVENTDAKK